MKRQLKILAVFLLASLNSFANGITGVWEQNPNKHKSQSDNKAVMYNLSRGNDNAIVFWQFTEDGHFIYEEANCGDLYNALRGHYSLSGSSLTLVVDEVMFHYINHVYHIEADTFEVGTTATISVTSTENQLTFSDNPFVEVGTLTLNRISNCSTFSPEDVLPGTWALVFLKCSGNLDLEENNATRLNPDHTLLYAWEYDKGKYGVRHVSASGSWSIEDNKLSVIYENSDNEEELESGLSYTYSIITCCPERVSSRNLNWREDYSINVFIPSDGSLIDKYFGGVSTVEADPSPRIITTGNSLQIENADNAVVSVFDIDGKTHVNQQSYDGKPISLPAGQYIVKVNDSVFKTLVR